MVTKISLFILIVALALSGCAALPTVAVGSGKLASEERSVSDFTRVELSGLGELEIRQGEQEGLSIEADDNLLPLLTSEVRDGVLILGVKPLTSLMPSQPIRYTLEVKSLDQISVSGSGSVACAGLSGERLTLRASGSGNFKLEAVQVQELRLEISGSGSMEIAGSTDSLTAQTSGLGQFNLEQLQAAQAKVTISGAGSARLQASESLDVNISGSGSVAYYGSPQLSQHISGAGSIRSLGSR